MNTFDIRSMELESTQLSHMSFISFVMRRENVTVPSTEQLQRIALSAIADNMSWFLMSPLQIGSVTFKNVFGKHLNVIFIPDAITPMLHECKELTFELSSVRTLHSIETILIEQFHGGCVTVSYTTEEGVQDMIAVLSNHIYPRLLNSMAISCHHQVGRHLISAVEVFDYKQTVNDSVDDRLRKAQQYLNELQCRMAPIWDINTPTLSLYVADIKDCWVASIKTNDATNANNAAVSLIALIIQRATGEVTKSHDCTNGIVELVVEMPRTELIKCIEMTMRRLSTKRIPTSEQRDKDKEYPSDPTSM